MRNFYSTSNQWDLILGADGITVCEQTSQLQFANRSDCDGASFRCATSISQCFVYGVYSVLRAQMCRGQFFCWARVISQLLHPARIRRKDGGLANAIATHVAWHRLASLSHFWIFLIRWILLGWFWIAYWSLLIVIDRYWSYCWYCWLWRCCGSSPSSRISPTRCLTLWIDTCWYIICIWKAPKRPLRRARAAHHGQRMG